MFALLWVLACDVPDAPSATPSEPGPSATTGATPNAASTGTPDTTAWHVSVKVPAAPPADKKKQEFAAGLPVKDDGANPLKVQSTAGTARVICQLGGGFLYVEVIPDPAKWLDGVPDASACDIGTHHVDVDILKEK